MYDPLGFVSPCILTAKHILQDLCRKRLSWDDEIPDGNAAKWKAWLEELPKLQIFKISRCIKPKDFTVKYCELNHFSDASEGGYGAVSYARLISEDDKVHCALLMAKSRLAPLKAITIPRLELSAAVLATRLDRIIREEIEFGMPTISSTFWTDSTCVLRYISNKEKRFQVFVANRITKILEQSQESQWRYVNTALNPADEASRGLSISSFLDDHRWTAGPEFLYQKESEWPQLPFALNAIPSDDAEVKQTAIAATSSVEKDLINQMITRFSSWNDLWKMTAWILRYRLKLRQAAINRKSGISSHYVSITSIEPITVTELAEAQTAILKFIQGHTFEEEINVLRRNQGRKVPKQSTIYKLDPILVNGVLRVGGRLQAAPISSEAKHPAILPKQHHIVNLIILHYHDISGHSGTEHTLSLIRQKFWIISGRTSLRSVLTNCVSCRKRQATASKQKMASLPSDRVTPSKPPFSHVGVDCFGPFEIKRGRTMVKRYGVLFTCLTIRAIHIEVATSLGTASFINALRRFISRRGQPELVRSDNGGNFVEGERELRIAVEEWNQAQIHNFLLQRNIKWIFNPPAGSHFGGVWERCIRSVRKVMKALMHQQTLDDESLATLMCEVEAIVNGRPITKLSNDPNDSEPLTPNHLLLLRNGPVVPPGTFKKDDNYSRRRWRQVQYLANVFWRRWINEYLPSLQQRQKWNSEQINLAVNDIVLVLDERTPRSSWPLGRVIEVHTNQRDGLVRSVKIKTSSSLLVRPVDKVILLEASSSSSKEK